MSTTIKSGSEYARLLEASGMAYELSPLSIAEKAFEEGADSLRAELARVRAERDGYRSDIDRYTWNLAGCDTIASGCGRPGDYDKTLALPSLDSVSRMASERDALRARVAEVEEQAERYRLVTLRQDATIAELTTDGSAVTLAANLAAVSQRNAELVAALRDAKSDFVSIGEYWNGGNGSALDAAARNSEYADEAALKVTAALAAHEDKQLKEPS